LFVGDFSGTSSDRTPTLGRRQWEGPFSPSPVLVGQAEEFPLISSFSSEKIGCRGLAGSITLLAGPFVEISCFMKLDGVQTFAVLFLFFRISVE